MSEEEITKLKNGLKVLTDDYNTQNIENQQLKSKIAELEKENKELKYTKQKLNEHLTEIISDKLKENSQLQ